MGEKTFAMRSLLRLDSMGAAVSIACAIQCSLFPLLFGVLPVLGLGFLLKPEIEGLFIVAAVLLGVSSFTMGFRSHRRLYIFIFLIGAFALLFAGRQLADERLELPLVVSGSLVLATGHFVNRRLCDLCATCDLHRQAEPKTKSAGN